MQKLVPVALLVLAVIVGVRAVDAHQLKAAAWNQDWHFDDKKDEHKEREPRPIAPGDFPHLEGEPEKAIPGPSFFSTTPFGTVLFGVGIVGWIALSAATWVLLRNQKTI